MNASGFNRLLADPDLLNEESLTELERLLHAYPYSENIRILYALNLLKQNDFRYQQNLTKAAFFASDRKKLKQLVEYIVFKQNLKQEDIEIEETDLDDEKTTNIEIGSDQKKELHPQIPEKVEKEDSIAQLTQNFEEPSEIGKTPATTASNTLESLPKTPDSKEKEKQHKALRDKAELLQLVKNRLAEIEATKKTQQAEQAEQINKPEEETKLDLIEQFIKNQPSISRPDKNEFFDPHKEAIDSTTDDDDFFVTETLAKIHGDQGNIQKAIEIYKKLILKFPEKSSYFAARIEDLSKK